jgi:hypothetical protein
MTDALAACVALAGIALVAMWLSPLEAQTLNVGHLLGLGQPEPRVSTLATGVGACLVAVLIGLVSRARRRAAKRPRLDYPSTSDNRLE